MNVTGLTMREISEKVKPCVTEYFKGSTVTNYDGELFQENYTLEYGEINVDLPQKHLFNDTDQINNASGNIYLADVSEEHKGHEYVVILLSNAEYTQALFLIIQKINQETGNAENTIIKNFIESRRNKHGRKRHNKNGNHL